MGMETLRIVNLFLTLLALVGFASPILGILRGVQNQSVKHAVLSMLVPYWGLVYFLAVKNKTSKPQTEGPVYIDDIRAG